MRTIGVMCVWLAMWGVASADTVEEKPYSRETVAQEILKEVRDVERARAKTIKAMERYRDEILSLRNGEVKKGAPSAHERIVEAQSVAQIADETAKVEVKKAMAAHRIAEAVDKVERLKRSGADKKAVAQAHRDALRTIARNVADVKKTEAEATRKIVALSVASEKRKATPVEYPNVEAVLVETEAKAKVKIAKAVTAVEIAKAVEKAETLKRLPPEALHEALSKYADMPLEKFEALMHARIVEIAAQVEIARAEALKEIAQIVATVEAVRHMHKGDALSKKGTTLPESYPKRLLRVKKRKKDDVLK